jgi:hypothetical protein
MNSSVRGDGAQHTTASHALALRLLHTFLEGHAMAKKRRAKRVVASSRATDRDDTQNISERAAESLTEIAAASGAQAIRFAAAVARGMAKGVAGAAREMRRPVRESAAAVRDTARSLGDLAAEGVETAADAGRAATTRRRRTSSSKRRSA